MIREPHYYDDRLCTGCDMSEIDTEVDLICENLGVEPNVAREINEAVKIDAARKLRLIVSLFTRPCKNIPAKVYGLIFAAELDEENAIPSQAEIARELGCSRALISHYTQEWRQFLNLKSEQNK